jgi:hypothetical protein
MRRARKHRAESRRPIAVVPDWICEVLSESNEAHESRHQARHLRGAWRVTLLQPRRRGCPAGTWFCPAGTWFCPAGTWFCPAGTWFCPAGTWGLVVRDMAWSSGEAGDHLEEARKGSGGAAGERGAGPAVAGAGASRRRRRRSGVLGDLLAPVAFRQSGAAQVLAPPCGAASAGSKSEPSKVTADTALSSRDVGPSSPPLRVPRRRAARRLMQRRPGDFDRLWGKRGHGGSGRRARTQPGRQLGDRRGWELGSAGRRRRLVERRSQLGRRLCERGRAGGRGARPAAARLGLR